MQIYNSGFLLSYSAVIGATGFFQALKELLAIPVLEQHKRLRHIAESLLLSVAIFLVTLPVVLSTFYTLPLYSIFLNLLVIPCMPLVVLLGMAGGILGCFHLGLGTFLLAGAHYILKLYHLLCEVVEALPWHTLVIGKQDTYQIILYLGLLMAGVYLLWQKKKRGGFLFVAALIVVFYQSPREGLRIAMLDVGQGECLVVEAPSGHNLMIDCGSTSVSSVGKYRVLPYLKVRGITTLDAVLITHTDSDHISGLLELLTTGEREGIEIRELILADTMLEDEMTEELITAATKEGVLVSKMKKGDEIKLEELQLRCLHPTPDYITESKNDTSLVLSLSYQEFDLLLTGDVEAPGEHELLTEGLKEYEVLKVAHHGSKNSSTQELLSMVSPEIGLISSGKNNRYGHPHPELLDRLREYGTLSYCTKEGGELVVWTDGRRYVVNEYVGE